MDKLRAPPALQFAVTNLAETCRKWQKQYRVYHTAAELSKKDKAIQAAILLNVAGAVAQDKF